MPKCRWGVDREEWLSENVYYYDRETGELEIVL